MKVYKVSSPGYIKGFFCVERREKAKALFIKNRGMDWSHLPTINSSRTYAYRHITDTTPHEIPVDQLNPEDKEALPCQSE